MLLKYIYCDPSFLVGFKVEESLSLDAIPKMYF